MPRTNLTDARVRALNPRKSPYDIRDGKLKGFGVRVTPTGRKRFFVHCQHRGKRVWKIVGHAGIVNVKEARSRAADPIGSRLTWRQFALGRRQRLRGCGDAADREQRQGSDHRLDIHRRSLP